MKYLLASLLATVGIGLILLLIKFLLEKKSFSPLFLLSLTACALASLIIGILILN